MSAKSMGLKEWCEVHGWQLFVISVLLLALVLAAGCGSDSKSKDPGPNPQPTPPPVDKAWLEVKPIIEANCGKCHNGVVHPVKFDTAAKFKGSKALVRIQNGSMPPPPAVLSAPDKAKLVAYLGG